VSDQSLEQIAIDRFMGPAWCVDLTPTEPRQVIGVNDLGEVAQQFQPGESLLLQTGWSRYVNDPERYRDGLPRIGDELAAWCGERGMRMLGVEPPSVADVNDLEEVTRIHQVLLGAQIVIVEGLTGLDRLPRGKRFTFVAAPLKIHGGDGAPCRAFAILDEQLDLATSIR
jgi:kynurenine formamidase